VLPRELVGEYVRTSINIALELGPIKDTHQFLVQSARLVGFCFAERTFILTRGTDLDTLAAIQLITLGA
jgi:hypothetical protein